MPTRQEQPDRVVEPSQAARVARDRVLFLLKSLGPRTAAELAARLGVTAMAVRQHLHALRDEGLVWYEDERRPVGRPARVWRLAPAAASRFPDTHGDLTVELLAAMRAALGEDGLERVLAERKRRQHAGMSARLPGPRSTLREKVEALAGLRTSEGYMAEWSEDAEGVFTLAENHCPVCAAATACQALCRDELALFRELLGDDCEVTRHEHIPAGGRRCTYRIAPLLARSRGGARKAGASAKG